jgi:hypothetical protein
MQPGGLIINICACISVWAIFFNRELHSVTVTEISTLCIVVSAMCWAHDVGHDFQAVAD